MDKQKSLKIFSKTVIYLTIVWCFLLIIFCFINEKGTNSKVDCEDVKHWSDNWVYNGTENMIFPYKVYEKKGITYSISNTLPYTLKSGDAILFFSHNTKFEVYIDNTLIYVFGNTISVPFDKMTGNILCFIPFKSEDAGKKIDIRITPHFDQKNIYSTILYGNQDTLAQYYIQINIPQIIIIIILLLISIVSLTQAFLYAYANWTKESHMLLYYSLTEINIAVWILLKSNILQFIINQLLPLSLLYFITLAMMPCLLSGLYKYIFPKAEKIYYFFELFGYLLTIYISCTYVLKQFNPPKTRIVLYLYGLVQIIVSLVNCAQYFRTKEKKDLQRHVITNIFFTEIILLSSLIVFFFASGNKLGIILLITATLLLSINFFYFIIKKYISNRELILEANAYKELTYTDPLTNIGNRQRLNKKVAELTKKLSTKQSITFIMCDLNYLKKVNDEFGHKAGDQLIIGASQCLTNACGDIATCYRLGGDEFCIILVEQNNSGKKVIERLHQEIDTYNEKNDHHISMAIGYITENVRKDDNFLHDMYQKADKNMYIEKQKQHSSNVQNTI